MHVNSSRIILCLKVKELHSYYIFISIFCVVVSKEFLNTFIRFQVFQSNTNNLHIVVWFQVFLCNTNNYMISKNYFYFIIIICLPTFIWFQVFLSNTNNLYTVVWFQIFLSNTNDLHTVVWFQTFLLNTYNYMISNNYFYLRNRLFAPNYMVSCK